MITSVFSDELSRDFVTSCEWMRSHGLNRVELRNLRTGRVPCVDPEEWKEVLAGLASSQIVAVSLSPGICKGRVDAPSLAEDTRALVSKTIACARDAGATKVTVFGFRRHPSHGSQEALPPEGVAVFREAIARLAEAGLTVAIENWQSSYVATIDQLRDLLDACAGVPLRVDFDPCNAHVAGERQLPADLSGLLARVASIHVKDASRGPSGFVHAPLGQGDVGWPALIRVLRRAGFGGEFALESHALAKIASATDDLRRFNELWVGSASH